MGLMYNSLCVLTHPPVALRKPTVYHCQRQSSAVCWHGAFCFIKRTNRHTHTHTEEHYSIKCRIYLPILNQEKGTGSSAQFLFVSPQLHTVYTNTPHYVHTQNSSHSTDQY